MGSPLPGRAGRISLIRRAASKKDSQQYFGAGAARETLGRKTARSGLIRVGGQFMNAILMLGTSIVLARLLTPRDFGLFAMVNSLFAFAGTIKDWGFPMATVQRETIGHDQVSALFWLTFKLNTAVTVAMALAAPAVAWFYGEPGLAKITVVMAAGFFFVGLGFQHESLLMRQMRFGTLMVAECAALVAGLLAVIVAAWLGAGYWALVIQSVTFGIVRSAGLWLVCGWRPARPGRRGEAGADIRGLLSYGAHYTGFRVLRHASRNADRVLIGYFRGATAVGYYDNAFRWSHNAIQNVYLPLQGVAVASFSRLQSDPAAYRAAVRRGIQPILAVVMPLLVFAALDAHLLIPVVFGDRWIEAVPLFRLLCVSAIATSLTRLTTWLYLSRGDTDRQLRWALLTAPLMILAVVVGIRWGTQGVAVGVAVVTWLLMYPTLAYCVRGTPIRMGDLLGPAAGPAAGSVIATFALLASMRLLPVPDSEAWRLTIHVVVFALTYALAWCFIPGGRRSARDLIRLMTGSRITPAA